NGPSTLEVTKDEGDKQIMAQVDALLSRMGKAKADGANPDRGLRMGELARASLERAGINVRGMSPEEYAPMALSRMPVYGSGQGTSDFPVVLENTMHKLVLSGFTSQPVTWDRFCKVGDVSDFRAWKRLVPGLMGNLDTVNEFGEYLNKNIPDAKANSITAVRRGNIISITPETLINDDLGYIQTMADDLGRTGARAIERAVYALIVANPTMSDGNALWSAAHNNIQTTGAPPTMALIDAAISAMRLQTAPGDDGEYLDIQPYAIVAHSNLDGTFKSIIGAEYDPDTANKLQKPNIVRNAVQQIVTSPRLGTAPWYLFADPNVNPVIEVVFLNGQREPRLTQEESFRTGGLSWRVELPFGVGAIDFRGTYQNDGA
ncbi:MAG: Clp protease ClpP, partial [Armatimonadia bacterium]